MKYITVGNLKTKGSPKTATQKKVQPTYWNYSDVPLDKKGWCIDKKYRPLPYDMCELQIEGKEFPINGWWDGFIWYALKKKKAEKVLKWRLSKEFV